MDQADYQRMLGMLETKETDPLIDTEINAEDLLYIGEENSDLSEAQIVVEDGSGRVRWTEPGSENGGLEKVFTQHGDQMRDYGIVETDQEIKQLIYRAIDESDGQDVVTEPNPGGGTRYYYQVSGGKTIRVVAGGNGFIFDAFPDSGANSKFD